MRMITLPVLLNVVPDVSTRYSHHIHIQNQEGRNSENMLPLESYSLEMEPGLTFNRNWPYSRSLLENDDVDS